MDIRPEDFFSREDGSCCCGEKRATECGWSSRSIFKDKYDRKPYMAPDEALRLRSTIGEWLRIRAKHILDSVGIHVWLKDAERMLSKDEQRDILYQLAADADHSDLLARLLSGEEPMEFEDWRKYYHG